MFRPVISVARGDGIGPEIMDATLHVLKAARVPLDFKMVDMGKTFYLKGYSTGMTPEAKAQVESGGILLKGPMETPKGKGVKSINVTARKVWSTYANKRVFQTLPGIDTVFSQAGIKIDLTMFRENIEDTYGGIEHYQTQDVAQCRRLISRPGCHQIHKIAFETAKSRNSKRITCVHKANIMKLTDGLFLETFYEVAKQYPELKADDAIVDDMAMKLVTRPDLFDVMVLPNLQGDIISDLAAGLVGGLGMAPSANIGDEISIFEAVHGTAPDIAGKGLANPTALLLSSLMMLRHLGLNDIAERVDRGLKQALSVGARTGDLPQKAGCKALSTMQFADAVVKHMPEATHVTVQVPRLKAPVAPKHNQLMVAKNKEYKVKTIGVDIFVDADLLPAQVAKTIQTTLTAHPNLKLSMISNRGTQVWPTGSVFTQCVNHYRCRIELEDSADKMAESELLKIVSKISEKIRVCSLEMLLIENDKKMYSLAQGQ